MIHNEEEITEGLWVCLSLFNLFQESFQNNTFITLPFGSQLMINKNVFEIHSHRGKILEIN